ncbi:helix-turn-helix domain-containing protein [Roseisolibacter sp. H3M3-2]|uniref:GlxA family transcriptional regulator n=1 Tax=Roseisolibacter sp. H3M3-2 TaxID=3031323 RepID=UPI0023DBEEDA|nr:helix-turn-helix domain-containing protein [Roseisolibacter sp. H3M3-2]MDF1504552.1 helix-turn-helix domain-containing protein [Roseisolibacter sp. H3M3-2]
MPAAAHRVAILALPSVVPFDLGVPVQVFGYPRDDLGARRYAAVVCGARRGRVPTSGGFDLGVAHGLEALADADTIVIPGVDDTALPIAKAVTRALAEAHARGARLVSICTGAFVLAEAGLLDGRAATTHWLDAPEFRARYPRVALDPDVLYVDEGRVLTSAGIASGIDLCLHVVRRDHGAAVANAVARRLVVAPHRSGGQAQFVPRPVAAPRGGRLEGTRAWLLARLGEPVTVARMAAHADMPLRTFARRFREETGAPPLHWLLRQRLLAAQQLLEETDLSAGRVAERCGIGSAVSLRAHFRRELGTSPLAYRRAFRAGLRA